jgi:hypothetical protein
MVFPIAISEAQKIWLDCTVRVDLHEFPIASPDPGCRPVALATTGQLYLVTQRTEPSEGGGYFVSRFSGEAFDLNHTEDPRASAEAIMRVFVNSLQRRMAALPLSAALDESEPLQPRELFAVLCAGEPCQSLPIAAQNAVPISS